MSSVLVELAQLAQLPPDPLLGPAMRATLLLLADQAGEQDQAAAEPDHAALAAWLGWTEQADLGRRVLDALESAGLLTRQTASNGSRDVRLALPDPHGWLQGAAL